MKGLLIGIHFVIKGIFQLVATLVVYIPVTVLCHSQHKFPVCSFIFYVVSLAIALIGIIAFLCLARRYHYLQRDEPDNIYISLCRRVLC